MPLRMFVKYANKYRPGVTLSNPRMAIRDVKRGTMLRDIISATEAAWPLGEQRQPTKKEHKNNGSNTTNKDRGQSYTIRRLIATASRIGSKFGLQGET